MTTRLLPAGPGLALVEVCFLVREDAVEDVDYDPEKVAAVWRATCEQDWELCENNYAGIRSVAYEPGPFSEVTESSVESFLEWYLVQLELDRFAARSRRMTTISSGGVRGEERRGGWFGRGLRGGAGFSSPAAGGVGG